MIRLLVAGLAMVLPMALRKWLLRAALGYEIHPTAQIGLSLIACRRLSLGPHARVGALTVMKGLDEVRLGPHARIGNLNWITGTPDGPGIHFGLDVGRRSRLVLGEHAAITHRHLIDCTDSVTIGRYTTVAGWGSQILTHAIDLRENRQSAAPVHVGEYCFVGTRVVLLKGASLGDRCVLAAGAVASGSLQGNGRLFGGVPAKDLGPVAADTGYFVRERGHVE